MDAYYSTPLSPFAPAVGVAKNTFTTKVDVSPLPCPIIPANALRPGACLKIEAEGEVSSTGSPTFVLGFHCGIPGVSGVATITTTFAETGALTVATGAAWPWRMEYRGKITKTGSTDGTIVGSGDCEMGTSLTAFTSTALPITAALRTVATLNTTVSNAIGVCATCSASSASNQIIVYQLTAVLLN